MSDLDDEPTLYEIVELPTGEIALRRAGDDDQHEPLVKIQLSEESRFFLGDRYIHVAKAMIEAGLEAVHDAEEDPEAEYISHAVH